MTKSPQPSAAVREYDAFGNVTSGTGAWAGPFGYAGKFGYQSPSIPGTSTPDEGLTLMGHRYYDPSTSRFLTRDPIFDGRNWYSYGGGEGNPLTGADPTGLAAAAVILGASGPPGWLILAGATVVIIIIGAVLVVQTQPVVGNYSAPENALLDSAEHVEKQDGGSSSGQSSDASSECPIENPGPGDVPSDDTPPDGWEKKHGEKGNYQNPAYPGASLRPDLNHDPSVAPHWDVHVRPNGEWRVFQASGTL